jgi:hypothetical protein
MFKEAEDADPLIKLICEKYRLCLVFELLLGSGPIYEITRPTTTSITNPPTIVLVIRLLREIPHLLLPLLVKVTH